MGAIARFPLDAGPIQLLKTALPCAAAGRDHPVQHRRIGAMHQRRFNLPVVFQGLVALEVIWGKRGPQANAGS